MNKHLLTLKLAVAAMLTTAIVVVSALPVAAQNTSIRGVVRDDTQNPLPGVSVLERGTTNGTVTDADGNFFLTVGSDAVLQVSFIGMVPMEVPLNGRSFIEISMQPDITELGEVIIIGYGSVERKDLASSVSTLSGTQLRDVPINSAAQAISGRLAGVQVITSEGSPDAQIQVRVRGGMSITGDNSPLYVVDGIQVENALNVLSPQDIESINVLKDASATAIYGSRGANGVVIITTKGGKGGKTVVNYNGFVGVRKLGKKLDVWNPYDFVLYQYERSRGGTATEQSFLETYGAYEDIELYKGVPFVDWQDQVFGRDALQQTHNISVSGGSEKTSFNLSLTSNGEEGVMMNSDFDRKVINFKLDHKISKKFSTGFNVRYNNTTVNGAGTSTEGSSSLNRLRHSVKYRPFVSAGEDVASYDPDYADQTNANSLALINPILLTQAEYKRSQRSTTNFSGYVQYDLTKFLSFRSTLGIDLNRQQDNIFNDTITSTSKANGLGLPMASIEATDRRTLNNSNVLTLSVTKMNILPDDHHLELLVGHEILEGNWKRNLQDYREFPVGITPELAFGTLQLGVPQRLSGTREAEDKLLSFFSRLTYSYNDKYFLTASMRSDGSSKFAPKERWGYFPAASLMWRISSESFMDNLAGTVSDMKVRASYGASGNARIDDYLYMSVFSANAYYGINNQQVIGQMPTALANNLLTWEGTIARNIGLDVGLFSNRLTFSADLYRNSSKDLLLEKPVPPTSGWTSQQQNVGETLNQGVELQLGGVPIDRNGLRWDVNFNISFNQNKIVSLGPNLESFLQSSGWGGNNQPADYIVKVGQPVGTIWGLVTDGFYTVDDFNYDAGAGTYTLKEGVPSNQSITSIAPQPGVIKFKDTDFDGDVDNDDRTVIGKATPKFFGGFNQTLAYKNFDLSVFVNFQVGNDVLNANKLEFTSGYTVNSNLTTEMNGRWRNVNAEGQVVTDPAALAELNKDARLWTPLTTASSFYVHSWAVEDGSFLRVNNITLGYTLPPSIANKLYLSKFRVYGTVNNIHTFTNYSGYDPEANTRRRTPLTPGVDYAAYPRSKGYVVGVNLTF